MISIEGVAAARKAAEKALAEGSDETFQVAQAWQLAEQRAFLLQENVEQLRSINRKLWWATGMFVVAFLIEMTAWVLCFTSPH